MILYDKLSQNGGIQYVKRWFPIKESTDLLLLLLFSCQVMSDSVTPWTAAFQASPSFTISWSLFKLMSIELVIPSNHFTLSHSLLFLPSIFPRIRVFSSELALCFRWPKYWSFSFNTSPSNEYSGLISFRMNSFGSPCSPRDPQESSPRPQFKSIDFLALSFLYSPTLTAIHDYWKNHSLNRQTFVSKVTSLLFNMLSRFVIAFLPRSKHLLTSWLQSPSAVILKPKKINSVTVSTSIYHNVMGPDAMILGFWMLSFKPAFSLSFFTFIKRLFSFCLLSAIRVMSSAFLILINSEWALLVLD